MRIRPKKRDTSAHAQKVWVLRNIHYRNSFQPVFLGDLRPASAGALLDGSIGVHPLVWVFLTAWTGFALFLLSAFSIAKIVRPQPNDIPWAFILAAPPVIALFFVVLVGGGRLLSRGEDAFLRQFLIESLDAREVNAAETAPGDDK